MQWLAETPSGVNIKTNWTKPMSNKPMSDSQ